MEPGVAVSVGDGDVAGMRWRQLGRVVVRGGGQLGPVLDKLVGILAGSYGIVLFPTSLLGQQTI